MTRTPTLSYDANHSRVSVSGYNGLVVDYGKVNGSSSFVREYISVSFIVNLSSYAAV